MNTSPTSLSLWLRDNRGFLAFLLAFGLMRTAIADWNPIPSGSMRPTLKEGDMVLVNRVAYDLKVPLTDVSLLQTGAPARGDVVTFSSPRDGTRLIKRIVGLPGDRIALRDGVLWINGQAAQYAPLQRHGELLAPGVVVDAIGTQEQSTPGAAPHAVQWLPQAGASRDWPETLVPEGHYFMLGDNRDNSADSRFIGPVPRRLLIGRAHRVLASLDMLGEDGSRWLPRFERFWQPL
ncbi:signal peptidase I [Roseateles paludis]|uniref:Signal peptidase I n=1 Tax=Roseateles paludis TaxID=3145238 RepID=A0ABV0G6X2_9BURK